MLQHADPSKDTVALSRPMFERIEDQSKAVAEAERRLTTKKNEHADAKKAYDGAVATLHALTSEMIRVVNGGPSDLPLFDNMTDRLEEAQADPVAQTLLDRLITHGYSNLNLLIVHGYTQEERGEVAAYLDALDARVEACAQHRDGHIDESDIPAIPEEPAFITPDAIAQRQAEQLADAPTDEQIADALADNDIQHMPGHAFMSAEQRVEVIAWAKRCAEVREEKAEALTFDDLPAAPSFVLNPNELMPVAGDEVADAPIEPEPETEKPRAKRRSAKEFKNTVKDQVKAKKGKGKK